jgi:hypothetical protein
MSSAFKNKLIISFAVLLVTSFCLHFFVPGTEYFITGLIFTYLAVSIHFLLLENNLKYLEYIEKRRGYLRYVGIVFIASLYFLWPSEYRQMMSTALKIRDAHPEQKVFDGEVEPPMPALYIIVPDQLGIDQNKNGIRDDVDIWINRTGKNYNERMAMRQYARSIESLIVNCDQKNGQELQNKIDDWTMGDACSNRLLNKKLISEDFNEKMRKVIYGNFIARCWDHWNKYAPMFNFDSSTNNPYSNCKFKVYQ